MHHGLHRRASIPYRGRMYFGLEAYGQSLLESPKFFSLVVALLSNAGAYISYSSHVHSVTQTWNETLGDQPSNHQPSNQTSFSLSRTTFSSPLPPMTNTSTKQEWKSILNASSNWSYALPRTFPYNILCVRTHTAGRNDPEEVGLIHKGNEEQISFAYELYATCFKTAFSRENVQVGV